MVSRRRFVADPPQTTPALTLTCAHPFPLPLFRSNSDLTRRSRCAPEPLQTFTTIARLSPMLSRSHPVHSFALAGVQVSCAASPLPTTAVQPHMQPMADRAPLCAQACRATASRPICSSSRRRNALHFESPNARASYTWWQADPLLLWCAQMLLYMALAPEEKLTYAAKRSNPTLNHSPLNNQASTPQQVQGGRPRRGGALRGRRRGLRGALVPRLRHRDVRAV